MRKDLLIVLGVALLTIIFPISISGSFVNWLEDIGGIMVFSGCITIAVLLGRFNNSGYVTISKRLVFWFNFFILVVGVWSLLTSLNIGILFFWRLVAGLISVYLAWNIYRQEGALKIIFSEREVQRLARVSKEIQKRSLVGFFWVNEEDNIHWSSGIYEIFGKPQNWKVERDVVIGMVAKEDRVKFEDMRRNLQSGISLPVTVKVNTDRGLRYVYMIAYADYENGNSTNSFGLMKDVTDEILAKQQSEIEYNKIIAELQRYKNELAISSFKKAVE